MKIAIMQPYFMPYIGYFQLMNIVDKFIVYDNLQFVKNGWIQRNRILVNGKDDFISLMIQKDNFNLNIINRFLVEDFLSQNKRMLRRIEGSYSKAPFFKEVFPYLEVIFLCPNKNLFEFIYNSLLVIKNLLNIKVEFVVSSTIDIDHNNLKSQDKVVAICQKLEASQYINPIGGTSLYTKDFFEKHSIKLNFIKSNELIYNQFGDEFTPWLSIIDVLMFNSKEKIQEFLQEYKLI